jgi:hypothetical protein
VGDEAQGVPSNAQLGGVIPHFFYDVIGRIIPGCFLIAGCSFIFTPSYIINSRNRVLVGATIEGESARFIFLSSLIIFSFAVSGYLVGFLVGPISFEVLEKRTYFRLKLLRLPDLTLKELFRSSGGPEVGEGPLKKAFNSQFGMDLAENTAEALATQSWLCSHFVWSRNSNLGQITSRWDAETHASREILFSALGLSGVQTAFAILYLIQTRHFYWRLWLCFLLITYSAWRTYSHARRRQIIGRFSVFYALSPYSLANAAPRTAPQGPTTPLSQ